jgi:hypothetical protein
VKLLAAPHALLIGAGADAPARGVADAPASGTGAAPLAPPELGAAEAPALGSATPTAPPAAALPGMGSDAPRSAALACPAESAAVGCASPAALAAWSPAALGALEPAWQATAGSAHSSAAASQGHCMNRTTCFDFVITTSLFSGCKCSAHRRANGSSPRYTSRRASSDPNAARARWCFRTCSPPRSRRRPAAPTCRSDS